MEFVCLIVATNHWRNNTTKAQQNVQLTSCGWLNFNQKLRNCLHLLKSYCLLTWRLFSWGKSLFHIEHYLYLLFFLQLLYFMPLACYNIGRALRTTGSAQARAWLVGSVASYVITSLFRAAGFKSGDAGIGHGFCEGVIFFHISDKWLRVGFC